MRNILNTLYVLQPLLVLFAHISAFGFARGRFQDKHPFCTIMYRTVLYCLSQQCIGLIRTDLTLAIEIVFGDYCICCQVYFRADCFYVSVRS